MITGTENALPLKFYSQSFFHDFGFAQFLPGSGQYHVPGEERGTKRAMKLGMKVTGRDEHTDIYVIRRRAVATDGSSLVFQCMTDTGRMTKKVV